jgi:hypothetical protein
MSTIKVVVNVKGRNAHVHSHTPVAIPLPTPPPVTVTVTVTVTVVVAGPAQSGAVNLSLQQTMDNQGKADRSLTTALLHEAISRAATRILFLSQRYSRARRAIG